MSSFKPKIQMVAIDQVKPYAKNPKIHTPTQIESLAGVIKTQGWDVPIVVDKDMVIIKGHGRRLAAIHLGLKEVPVIVRSDMTPAQTKAARLSDNHVALGDFDTEMVRDELKSLNSESYDLANMGFNDKELEMMIGAIDAMDDSAFEDLGGPDTPGPVPTPADSGDASTNAPQAAPSAPGKAATLADVLGFRFILPEHERPLARFQALAEHVTEKKGAEAFGAMCERLVTEMESRL